MDYGGKILFDATTLIPVSVFPHGQRGENDVRNGFSNSSRPFCHYHIAVSLLDAGLRKDRLHHHVYEREHDGLLRRGAEHVVHPSREVVGNPSWWGNAA